ncbi:MAG TPA: DUF2089 family protein [Sedimentisphaerales bacterium]|nr:DUF2089 family protein [Sedimentisphaerales bacterium]
MAKNLPTKCPSCGDGLKVRKLICESCSTEIEGAFSLPKLAVLSSDDQRFIVEFVKASGSLKDMAKLMKLSYPTIRSRLNDIIERIRTLEPAGDKAGEITKGLMSCKKGSSSINPLKSAAFKTGSSTPSDTSPDGQPSQ